MRSATKAGKGARGKAAGTGQDAGAFALDDVDEQIIAALRKNGRVANRDIARDMALNEATVRTRLRRLEDASMVRVAERLAALPEIGFVATTLGRADVLAMTLVENGNELTDFLRQTIDKIPGMRRVRCSLGQNFIKHDYRWCALVD